MTAPPTLDLKLKLTRSTVARLARSGSWTCASFPTGHAVFAGMESQGGQERGTYLSIHTSSLVLS